MSDPSEGFTKLSAINGPEAGALGSLSIQSNTLRSYIPLSSIAAESGDRTETRDGGSPRYAHINKCMLLLLMICVTLAGAALGAVAYWRHDVRPSTEDGLAPVQPDNEQQS
jgi:hypothetical protein